MAETRYQRIAREQRERQEARMSREAQAAKDARITARVRARIARRRKTDRAYEDWCMSDFPNQSDN